ncbi:MAG: hypothetical protein HRT61_21055 [Ekhidna sp.]|nr:hypothetical protein [Ekhidna sp.]
MFKIKGIYWIGFAFTIIWFAGLLFKLLHLQGAGLMMIVGSGALLLVFVPLYIVLHRKHLARLDIATKVKWSLGLLSMSLLVAAITMQMMHLMGTALVWIWISTISVVQNVERIPK